MDATAQRYVRLAEQLGRPPVPAEFGNYAELLERFGSPARIDRLARQVLSPNGINEVQQKRREDILTYAAMMRLQGVKPVPFRSLPRELQADIKMLWQSYSAALREGRASSFRSEIQTLCAAAVNAAPWAKSCRTRSISTAQLRIR